MPVKYECQKCGRKFIDWGAEKLGFKCPECDDEELVRIALTENKPARRPSLRRKAKKKVAVPLTVEEEVFVPNVESTQKAETDEDVGDIEDDGGEVAFDADDDAPEEDTEDVTDSDENGEGEDEDGDST